MQIYYLSICIILLHVDHYYGFHIFGRNIRSNSANFIMSSKIFENFDALLFDCDGVIAETERDAHRITFNKAFTSMGISSEWDVTTYGELLKIGGGKERMTKYFNDVGWPDAVVSNKEQFIKQLHLLKTEFFKEVLESGSVPLRSGVTRLMDEAFSNNIAVAICSTSSEDAVTTVARRLLGEDRLNKLTIFAGDVVSKKKPSPDIYLLASESLNVAPNRCWVIEDSEIGLKAAKSAGMKCLVTKSFYTKDEDFTLADVVINGLDQGLDGPVSITYLNYKASTNAYKAPIPTKNADMFGADPNYAKMFSKIVKGEGGLPFGM